MIRSVRIENFKSIASAKVELGRVNVLIGENGAGKSNFLEALAFGAAAAAGKLDHEFLATRGVRVTAPELMVSAFEHRVGEVVLFFRLEAWEQSIEWHIQPPYAEGAAWTAEVFALSRSIDADRTRGIGSDEAMRRLWSVLKSMEDERVAEKDSDELRRVIAQLAAALGELPDDLAMNLSPFLVYSPEYSALRVFREETQILPVGINGEGLFAHLKALSKRNGASLLSEISDQLDLVDWFEGFKVPSDLAPGERTLRLRDRYLVEQQVFDQRSANEGFLFLLFYFTLLISPDTPAFFAVDNIDASLNPKLCTELVRRVVKLAETHGKQVILTTHNPAVLDGLDLADDEQRLFAVSRDSKGRTRVKRVAAPKPVGNDAPMRLSEAFVRGYLGALPKNF